MTEKCYKHHREKIEVFKGVPICPDCVNENKQEEE